MRYVVKTGALWLLIVGVLLMLPGGILVGGGTYVTTGPCFESVFIECDDGPAIVALGLLVLAVSVAHLAAFVGVWNRRSWGRWLGAVLAIAGIAICAALMSADWVGDAWSLPVVPVLGYGLTFVGLFTWYPDQ
jgi:hypothetical protein